MRFGSRGFLFAFVATLLPAATATAQVSSSMLDQLMQSSAQPASGFSLLTHLIQPMFLAFVFTVLGLVLFAVALWLIVKLAPFSVRKEIEEDQNAALGVIVGSIILGISIILAAAMIG